MPKIVGLPRLRNLYRVAMPAHFNGWMCSQRNSRRRAYKCRATYYQRNLDFSSFLVSGSSLQIPTSAFLNNSSWPVLSDSTNMRNAPSSKVVPPTNAHAAAWVGCWEPSLSRGRNRRKPLIIYLFHYANVNEHNVNMYAYKERESPYSPMPHYPIRMTRRPTTRYPKPNQALSGSTDDVFLVEFPFAPLFRRQRRSWRHHVLHHDAPWLVLLHNDVS